MIAKLIVWGRRSRPRAVADAAGAGRITASSASTTTSTSCRARRLPAFVSGRSRYRADRAREGLSSRRRTAAGAGLRHRRPSRNFCAARRMLLNARASADPTSPWHARDGWRLNGVARRSLIFRFGDEQTIVVAANAGEGFSLAVGDATFAARGKDRRPRKNAGRIRRRADGRRRRGGITCATSSRRRGGGWSASIRCMWRRTAGGHGGLLRRCPAR